MGRVAPFAQSSPSGRSSPMGTSTLTASDIVDALTNSKDGGQTLDFSHRGLVDVGEVGAQELAKLGREDVLTEESPVHRIALAGNRLVTLPMSFSLLSRLRYLNLRSNSFSVFPEVLTILPSLEILDFGRNKLKRLPSNPGKLVNLRVLSLTRNRIQRLPSYLADFNNLIVLRVDHNPIDWPPKSVMEPQEKIDDPEAMHQWVESLKSYLEESKVPADQHPKTERRPSDESLLQSESSETDFTSLDDSSVFWASGDRDKLEGDDGITPHARSFSIDSELSIYSISSSVGSQAKPERPTPLILDSLSSSGYDSPVSFLPTPEGSFTSAEDSADSHRSKQHGRNASVAVTGMMSPRTASLMNKKSMPDLRTAKVQFTPDRPLPKARPQDETAGRKFSEDIYTPISATYYKPSSSALPEVQPLRIRSNSRPVPQMQHTPSDDGKAVPSMDYERNSYFRRLSALPANHTVPPQLLSFVDAVRGILFAVSQVYQSLHHYTVYAIDERLSSVLLKVLIPASTYMSRLIDYLDRFDATCRRGFPSPAICRSVVECCRDNVAVFGKALSVLALQLKVLATRDDARYTRQMLLVFYGATAEISNAWHNMVPHLDAVEPYLQDHKPIPMASKSHLRQQASLTRVTIPPIAEQPEPPPASAPAMSAPVLPTVAPPFARSQHVQVPLSASSAEGRTRMARRHAGSFSAKDVQIGKSMVNAEMMSPISANPHSHSPTPSRQLQRFPLTSVIPPMPPIFQTPAMPPASAPPVAHSRHNSQASNTPSPGTSSGALSKSSTLDIPSSSNTLVDKPAIDAMTHAVTTAPAVWSMMADMLNDMPELAEDLQEQLQRAESITTKLRSTIAAVQEGRMSDRKTLRDDAHAFTKSVISLSNVVKTNGSTFTPSSQLRKEIANLTSVTQEFVMLLHVSSFSSPSTPRSHSPMLAGPGHLNLPSVMNSPALGREDMPQGALLGRSRTYQATTQNVPPLPLKEVPKSALPHQAFKIPPPPSRTGTKI